MPRKPKPLTVTPSMPTFKGELSDDARKLIDEIESSWTLNAPVRALLKLAGESLTVVEECDRILAAEGLVIRDNKGSVKPHPCAVLARDARTHASNTIQKVLLALG